jgi:type II secretion system protein N
MKPSKKTLLYTAYVIGITVFFLYYLFPSDAVKTFLVQSLRQENPDIAVTIDRISPVLPPGIKLHDVDISYGDMELITLEDLKIIPRLLSLFSEKTSVNFKGGVYAGTLSGRAELNGNRQAGSVKIDGRIAGVRVQDLKQLQRMSAHKISGDLGGDFNYADTGPNRSLTGKLILSDFRVELEAPVFNQKSLDFKNIDAELALSNRNLIIKQCSARGNQLDVDIRGTIGLYEEPNKNALKLTGSMTPHHVLLAQIEKSLPLDLLRKTKSGNSSISFRIDGTVGDPGFSLN